MEHKKLFIIGGIVGFVVLVVALSLVFGGGGKRGPLAQVSLEVWGTFEDTQNMQPFLTDYQAKRPNVQITYTEKNVETYEEDLLDALASGTGPDIFGIHNDWLPEYYDKLAEVDPAQWSVKEYKETFLKAPTEDFIRDGKIYAAPLSMDSLALYYNKSILGSAGIGNPPKTWTELKDQVRRITRKSTGSSFIRSGVALGTTNNINRPFDIMYLLMLQNGVVPYTSDYSQATLNSQQGTDAGNIIFPAAEALAFYTTFSNSVSDVYTWNTQSDYSLDAFSKGYLGFVYGYSYARDYITQKSPNLDFGIAPVPQPSLEQDAVHFANYWGFAVSKQSQHTDYAWDFIKFMTSKEQLTNYYKRHNLPAVRYDMIDDQIKNDADMTVFAASNLNARRMYKEDAKQVDQIISEMIDSVVLRGEDHEQAVSRANQQINSLSR